MIRNAKPMLVTFDGEARSGKGTIVQLTKDYLRDECGYKVMLIDRGQTFRTLVVATERAGVDIEDPAAIDAYLEDEANIASCVQFVKDVYHMTKDERDALLYTNKVGADSAKIGARPASQEFVKMLTKKWLHDAGEEGYEVVLVDGRTLEAISREMQTEGLCDYRLGLYFVCDPLMGARRTLGYAAKRYDELAAAEQASVQEFVAQINERNRRDKERSTERLAPPENAPVYTLPNVPRPTAGADTPMYVIDTSAELTKEAMSQPVAVFVAALLAEPVLAA